MNEKDTIIINNLRMLSIDMINEAGSGHPGIALGAAPIIYTLYAKHMNVSTNDDKWLNRDRFIMSAGHGSALLYANLYMAGFHLSLDDLKNFRKIGSKTPGHPELNVTTGVDFSTGPLGQGLASAVGIALGESYLNKKYEFSNNEVLEKKFNLYDFYTYVLCGDGDLMEGVSQEAISLAGQLGLGKLIVLYDSNNITLDGNLSNSNSENVQEKFESMGWHYQLVEDSENIGAIDDAIFNAQEAKSRPSIIEIKTVIGKYSENQGTEKVHGKPLSKSDIRSLRQTLGMGKEEFVVDSNALIEYKRQIFERSNQKYTAWVDIYTKYVKTATKSIQDEIHTLETGDIDIDFDNFTLGSIFESGETMREANNRAMQYISEFVPNLIGGSADVMSSTLTKINNSDFYSRQNRLGRNINFGVREHAMGCIINGISTLNIKCFGSTFLAFADYLKPALRMAALMELDVTYIFTHDDISVGEDGKTHQPIEQLDMLRSIPLLDVYRPADTNELLGCWDNIYERRNPSALVVSKNVLSQGLKTNKKYVKFGAYPVMVEEKVLHGIIVATGTDVKKAVDIATALAEKGLYLRVISMPCPRIYEQQSLDYRKKLLPLGIKTFVLESSTAYTIARYATNYYYVLNLESFGLSGKGSEVVSKLGFDVATLSEKIESLLR